MAFQHVSGEMPRSAASCPQRPQPGARSSQWDKRRLTWRSVRHSRAFRNCPALPHRLQPSSREEERDSCWHTVLHPWVRLCLCHLDSERVQATERKKKKIENTCLKGRNTPPREGMQQWEPRALARLAQPPEARWAPEDLTLTPQPWISKMDQLIQAQPTHLWPQRPHLLTVPDND